jgi:hypothetical protein
MGDSHPGWVPDNEGWRKTEIKIDTVGDHVRITVYTVDDNRAVFSARLPPEVARTLAQILTINSMKAEEK